jgi:hypothetical protein
MDIRHPSHYETLYIINVSKYDLLYLTSANLESIFLILKFFLLTAMIYAEN